MKLYIKITKMNFKEDDIEHNIIRGMLDKKFLGYDEIVELPDNDKFIKDTLKIIYIKDKRGEDTKEIKETAFTIREQNTWWGFPLYELKEGKIIPFDYNKYSYFAANTDRRMMLAGRISQLYNPSSEMKILRKTLKYIMDNLELNYPDEFSIMDKKIEEIIKKNPKDKSK
jgi:hypothetical protein